MDVAYINPFITAAAGLFETMIKVPLKLGRPMLRTPDEPLFRFYQYSAMIDLSGSVKGRIVLSFAQPVALALVQAMSGGVDGLGEEDIQDALGEIANIIVGNAKTTLPDAANVRISVPIVMATDQIAYPANVPVIVIPFDTSAGRFVLETAIRPAARPAAREAA